MSKDRIARWHWAAIGLAAAIGVAGTAHGASGAAMATSGDARQGDGGVSDFYRWPGAVPTKPGQMLRSEPLPAAARLASAGKQLRILYSSTDGLTGQLAVVVSGALFLPKGTPPKGGWPLIAWAHGTVGVADSCAPSWNARSERDAQYLNSWLAKGYAVVSSDYAGLGTAGLHPYMSVRTGAYGVLDSIRAVAGRAGVGSKTVVVGQSQGAGVAFGTAAYAPVYAAELDLRGTVATGVPYYTPKMMTGQGLQAGAEAVRPETAFLLYMALAGQLGDASVTDERLVSAKALPLLIEARKTCVSPMMDKVVDAGLSRAQVMGPSFAAVLNRYARELVYPTLKLQTPIFIGAGAADEFTAAPLQMMLASDACAAGSTVEAHLYPGLDHSGAVNGSLADSGPFVRKLFDGEAVASNCAQVGALGQPARSVPPADGQSR